MSSLSLPRIALLVALAGCIEPSPEAEPSTDPAARVTIPAVVDYRPGTIPAGTLFPAGVEHLQVMYTPGQVGITYAWGIAGERILWIYRVRVADGDPARILAEAAEGWLDAEELDARASFGGAGTVKGELPKPPTPPGQPEFTLAYAELVVAAAQVHAAETQAMIADLEAMH
jgi:hypothetical protein